MLINTAIALIDLRIENEPNKVTVVSMNKNNKHI